MGWRDAPLVDQGSQPAWKSAPLVSQDAKKQSGDDLGADYAAMSGFNSAVPFGNRITAGLGAVMAAPFSDEGVGDLYNQMRQSQQTTNENHPTSNALGTGAGIITSLPLAAGAGGAMKGSNALLNAAKAAGTGAATGAVYGYGDAPEGERFHAAGRGALWGGGIGAAAEPLFALGSGAVKAGARALGLENPTNFAIEKIQKAAQKAGINLSDALNKLEGPKPLGLADTLGDTGQSLAGTAYRSSIKGKQTLADALNERTAGSGQRLQQDLSETLTKNQNPYSLSQDLLERRSQDAKPLYDEAFNSGAVNSDRIQQFLTDPELKSGISRGLKIQRLEARAANQPFNPNDYSVTGFNEAGDPILGEVPNMRLLDAGKKGLDAMIGDHTDPVTGKLNEMGRALVQYKNSYLNELDNLNPSYKAARGQYSGQSELLNAVNQGQDAASKGMIRNLPPEKISSDISRLNDIGKQAYATGMAGQLRQEGPANIRNMFNRGVNQGEEQLLPNLEAGFNGVGGNFNEFQNRQLQEALMQNTKYGVMGNSRTAERAADDANHLGIFKDAVTGNLTGVAKGLLKTFDISRGFTEKNGAELARLLQPIPLEGRQSLINELSQIKTSKAQALAKALSQSSPIVAGQLNK